MPDSISIIQFEGTTVECSPSEDVDIILHEADPNIDTLDLLEELLDSTRVFILSKCPAKDVFSWLSDHGIDDVDYIGPLDTNSSRSDIPPSLDTVLSKETPLSISIYGTYPFLESVNAVVKRSVSSSTTMFYYADPTNELGCMDFFKVEVV